MDNSVPAYIHLYNDGAAETLIFSELITYLQGMFPHTAVDIRGDFYAHFNKIHNEKSIEQLAHQIAGIRVRNINQANSFSEPLPGEIDFEKKGIKKPQVRAFGILYDGFELSLLLQNPISPVEFSEKKNGGCQNKGYRYWMSPERQSHQETQDGDEASPIFIGYEVGKIQEKSSKQQD